MARRHGSAQFNDVFAISKIAVCRAPPVARRHGSARLNEARWPRLCHFKLDLDGLITEDGIASIMIFQVRSGWLDQRGRVQPRCWPHRSYHSSGRAGLDYAISKFYLDGLFIEAEFNANFWALRSYSTKMKIIASLSSSSLIASSRAVAALML